jgi:hypothetical protein
LANLLLLCALILSAMPRVTWAWGREGHAIVADIAEAQLTHTTLTKVRTLLLADFPHSAFHLSDISSWADEIKDTYPHGPQHGVRLQVCDPVCTPDYSAQCPNPDKDLGKTCGADGVVKYWYQMKDPAYSLQEQIDALKFVVHLVGDIHQPLHCASPTGNMIVKVGDDPKIELHKVWDTQIILHHTGSAMEIAEELMRLPRQVQSNEPNGPSCGCNTLACKVQEWVFEGYAIARDTIYADEPCPEGVECPSLPPGANAGRLACGSKHHPFPLLPSYYDNNWPTVQDRLQTAGDRLAELLNVAFDPHYYRQREGGNFDQATPGNAEEDQVTNSAEGFEDVENLRDWVVLNNSEPSNEELGNQSWFQGKANTFPSQSGAPDAYTAADYEAVNGVGTISNWLLLPPMTLKNGTVLSFSTRTVDPVEFADRLQVRMSMNGTSTNVGSTATSVGDFTTLLLDINPTYTLTDYPTVWTQYNLTVTGVPNPTVGRFAFRYFVEDGGSSGTNASYIGLDSVSVTRPARPGSTPKPEPSVTVSPMPRPSSTPKQRQ